MPSISNPKFSPSYGGFRPASPDRRAEVIDACTKCFLEKGLGETSVRDLSESIHLRAAGIYSYFESKDDAVRVCAEKAAMDVEKSMLLYAVQHIQEEPKVLLSDLFAIADENASLLRFYTQVVTSPRYAETMAPFRQKFNDRITYYNSRCAEKLGLMDSELSPVFRMGVSAYSHYMIYGRKSDIEMQVKLLTEYLENLEPALVR